MDLSGLPRENIQKNRNLGRLRAFGEGDETTQINSRICNESSIEISDHENSKVIKEEC